MDKLIIPKVIGFRGASGYAPENTLASIHAAADLGMEWVHINAKISKDGVPVLFHDENLLRCTGTEGIFANTDFKSLRELDAGSWFSESFVGEKIPTLEEALEAIEERGMGVNIEITPCPGREVDTAEAVLDVASRLWGDDDAPPLISSLQYVSLETAFDMLDSWPRGLHIDEEITSWKEIAEHLDVSTLHALADGLTDEQVDTYIDLQKPLLIYPVNDPQRAKELLRWGADHILSATPDLIRETLQPMN